MRHGFVRQLLILLLDLAVLAFGVAGAFFLRFEFRPDAGARFLMWSSLPLAFLGYLLPFRYFKLYSGLWRYSSFRDLIRIVEAVSVGFVLFSTLALFSYSGSYPRSVLLLSAMLTFLGICAVRFSIRFGKEYLADTGPRGTVRSALIVGAGDLGESVLTQLLRTPALGLEVTGFIDDDPAKWDKHIHDTPILGGMEKLPEILRERPVDEVVIAINARRGDVVRSVADALVITGSRAELKIAPDIEQALHAPGAPIALRKVRPADLLSRPVARLDEQMIARFLAGKSLLVTGAGGTIGSELCRQVLQYGPARLVLLECHATSLFYIEREVRERARATEVVPVLGSVLDAPLVERIFADHRPQVVLHAAAHKHVSQLEDNIHEAIRNNVLATHLLAETAHRCGSESFLLVSTDKAIRPRSVMGATKRAAEAVVRAYARESRTRFLAVRFGNVLGSSGSVLRIFQEQIENGGPVTVTHPEMTRYFMTVEEAVQLILQACAMAEGGEIFMLKMGEPVRILDLAKNLILLNGLRPDVDVKIEYTGIRPGEKLHEDLLDEPGEAADSGHPEILRVGGRGGTLSAGEVNRLAEELQSLCDESKPEQALVLMGELLDQSEALGRRARGAG